MIGDVPRRKHRFKDPPFPLQNITVAQRNIRREIMVNTGIKPEPEITGDLAGEIALQVFAPVAAASFAASGE